MDSRRLMKEEEVADITALESQNHDHEYESPCRHMEEEEPIPTTTTPLLSLAKRSKPNSDSSPNPGPTSPSPGPVYMLPDEILSNILERLHSPRDLCSARQSCRWWWSVGSQDRIWECFRNGCHFGSQDKLWENFLTKNYPYYRVHLPKWAMVKSSVLIAKIKQRLNYFDDNVLIGFDYLRLGLLMWWYMGRPNLLYNSKLVHFLMCEVSLLHAHKFMGVVFSEITDNIAHILMDALAKFDMKNQRNILKESSLVLSASPVKEEEDRECQGLVGIEIWGRLELLWLSYERWLGLVFSHCSELNNDVRTCYRAQLIISSIYDKGLICFRNQVLLKFGLRKVLHSGYTWLISRIECGAASKQEVKLRRFICHLLQEVDVSDDFTLSPTSFTQVKLHRRCPIMHPHKSYFSYFS